MARLFISHSSRNDDKAKEVRDWLAKNGWDDVFLDVDPERGIVAGQRWKDALQKAAQRCEMVLALISAEWLASPWCKAEIDAARLMGKKVIVALIGIDKAQVPPDLNDEQWIDLTGDPNAYTRLKEGLTRGGLDPSSFPFEAGRRPYPGFASLEEKDAAIFFGRDAQIVRGLDKIRSLVRAGVERMLVILGASGSGKSSFFRAGLWPRLKRDDRTWLPLPTIRPERAAISGKYGLVQALQQVMSGAQFADEIRKRGLPRSRAEIQDFIDKTEDGLLKIFAALRDIAHVPGLSGETTPPPTIVLAVDQGEELFNEDGRDEARRFIEILNGILKADPHALAILVMRSDSFPQLQTDAGLADLPKDTFTLDTMLEGSYRAVIEGPARLVQPNPLKIDPQLSDALLQDVSGQDALPLLAFTLAHLYENYAADNGLNLADYEKLGRLKGVIATTVREAFEEGVAKGELPKDAKAQLALARMAFIPHLARVNPAGQFVRRIATRAGIPAEARPLIDRFAERRLLIRDRRKIAGEDVEVIEVAHEAMLREWRELHDALLEEREFLVAKGQLEQDVADWRAASKSLKSGALLAGNKLLRARDWLIKRPQELSVEERQFVQASVEKAAERRRRMNFGIAAAFLLILGLLGYAIYEARKAEAEKEKAEKELTAAVSYVKNLVEGVSKYLDTGAVSTLAARELLVPAEKALHDLEGIHVTSEVRGEQIRLLLTVSDAYVHLAETENAQSRAEEARRLVSDLIAEQADNAEWKRLLYGSHFRIGDALDQKGRLREAQQEYEKALKLANELAQARPDSDRQFDLIFIHEKVGDILKRQADSSAAPADLWRAALDYYERARKDEERLLKQDQSNFLWLSRLAATRTRIGQLLAAQQKYIEALEEYREAAVISKKLADADQKDKGRHYTLAVRYSRIGRTFLAMGKSSDAVEYFQKAMTIREKLSEDDPKKALFKDALASSYVDFGDARKAGEKWDDAAQNYQKAIDILQGLSSKDSADLERKSRLEGVRRKMEGVSFRQKVGEYTRAREQYEAERSAYWRAVAEKRLLRLSKRRSNQEIALDDYVLTQPPVYRGPPKPIDPSAPISEPALPPSLPVVGDFLNAAKAQFDFEPQRPQTELEYKRAYAAAAAAAGLTKEQVVRIYAFEASGNGGYDVQAGLESPAPGARPISTALGYNQLLNAGTIELMARHGDRFLASLRTKANGLSGSPRAMLDRKLAVLQHMVDISRTVPDSWSEYQKVAKTPVGRGLHAANLDIDIGPLLQVQALVESVVYARQHGLTGSLSAAELEMLNLTGDENGLDIVTMPAALRNQVPTSNFFEKDGYDANPVASGRVVAELIAATNAVMDREAALQGAGDLAAVFPQSDESGAR